MANYNVIRPVVFLAEQIVRRLTKVFPFHKIDPLSIKELSSYEGRNYFFRGTIGGGKNKYRNSDAFVLKVAHLDGTGLYEEIANVLLFLHERGFTCPQPVETKDGYMCDTVTANEMTAGQTPVRESYTLRVLVFIHGEMMINYLPKTPLLYYKYGQALGKLNHLTMSYISSVEAIRERRFQNWDLSFFLSLQQSLEMCNFSHKTKKLLEECFEDFQSTIIPAIPGLTSSLRHGDYNDYNVLICSSDNKETVDLQLAVIDFDDAMYGPCVFDLSTAVAYTMLKKEDPLRDAVHAVRGYLSEMKLPHSELMLLPTVLKARLAQSLINASVSLVYNPDNSENLGVHSQYAEDLLHKLSNLPLATIYE